jgi:hypothetical protein
MNHNKLPGELGREREEKGRGERGKGRKEGKEGQRRGGEGKGEFDSVKEEVLNC